MPQTVTLRDPTRLYGVLVFGGSAAMLLLCACYGIEKDRFLCACFGIALAIGAGLFALRTDRLEVASGGWRRTRGWRTHPSRTAGTAAEIESVAADVRVHSDDGGQPSSVPILRVTFTRGRPFEVERRAAARTLGVSPEEAEAALRARLLSA